MLDEDVWEVGDFDLEDLGTFSNLDNAKEQQPINSADKKKNNSKPKVNKPPKTKQQQNQEQQPKSQTHLLTATVSDAEQAKLSGMVNYSLVYYLFIYLFIY